MSSFPSLGGAKRVMCMRYELTCVSGIIKNTNDKLKDEDDASKENDYLDC